MARELAFKLVEVTPDLIALLSRNMGWELREGREPVANLWSSFSFNEQGRPRQYAVGGVMRIEVRSWEEQGRVWEYVAPGEWIGPVALERPKGCCGSLLAGGLSVYFNPPLAGWLAAVSVRCESPDYRFFTIKHGTLPGATGLFSCLAAEPGPQFQGGLKGLVFPGMSRNSSASQSGAPAGGVLGTFTT